MCSGIFLFSVKVLPHNGHDFLLRKNNFTINKRTNSSQGMKGTYSLVASLSNEGDRCFLALDDFETFLSVLKLSTLEAEVVNSI